MSIILLIMSWIVISVRFRIALLQIRTSEMYDLVVGNILVSDKKNHLQTNTDGFFKILLIRLIANETCNSCSFVVADF